MNNLPFTYEELQMAVENRRVTKRPHPTLPFDIYNYTDEVQYRRRWDEITLNCRGLILDRNGYVIARPWKKFFNLGEVELGFQFTDPVEVMDKSDGSLGILYNNSFNYVEGNSWIPDSYAIATRGSFTSGQAIFATENIWNKKYAEYYDDLSEQSYLNEYTVLFEIIYPKNRIVINYHGMEDLVLLGAVEKSTGYYLGPREIASMIAWPGPVVEVIDAHSITEAIASMGRKNREGFVVRRGNFLVKIKEPEYLDLHKLVTNLTERTIWKQLRDGKDISKIISDFPDEFHKDVSNIITPLMDKFRTRLEELGQKYTKYMDILEVPEDKTQTRKVFANLVKKDKDAKYMFLMLDNKDVTATLWQELQPREEPNELRSVEEAD